MTNRPIGDIIDKLIETIGGCIVSSDQCTPSEIAEARAMGRFFVRYDGLGFVVRTPQPTNAEWTTADKVDEQRWYWHWNGDPGCMPLPTNVFRDSAGVFFRTRGQLGCDHPANVTDLGGFWMKMYEPELPTKEGER